MGSFFIDLAVAGKDTAYGLISDGCGLSSRPLALVSTCAPATSGVLSVVVEGDLLPCFVFTVSCGLIVVSCGAIFGNTCCKQYAEPFGRLLAAVWMADGLAQLPGILLPTSSVLSSQLPANILSFIHSYPVTHTGVFAVMIQVRLCPCIVANCNPFDGLPSWLDIRLWQTLAAVCLRYMSMATVVSGGVASWVLYCISVFLFIMAVVPSFVVKMLEQLAEKLCEYLQYLCEVVYNLLQDIIPKIRACLWRLLVNSCTRYLYELCQPLWNRLHTLCMPVSMAVVAHSYFKDVAKDFEHPQHLTNINELVLLFGKIFCTASATISMLMLGWHGFSRVHRTQQPDPLRYWLLTALLKVSSDVISSPWRAVRTVGVWLLENVCVPVFRFIEDCFGALFDFATSRPIFSIPLVLLANVLLIWKFAAARDAASRLFGIMRHMGSAALGMQDAVVTGHVTDSGLAVLVIAVVQILTFTMVANLLDSVRMVRSERTGDALRLEELNDLAVAMADPRQCARCGFGPVDHRGCSDLRTHHMEITTGGASRSQVSNACPRCGWFTRELSNWPSWDGNLQTEGGRAMFRQRVWCEVVVGVRAISKALLFPFGLLKLSIYLPIPASLSVFLAFSYLIPWTTRNASVVRLLNDGTDFGPVQAQRAHRPPTARDPEEGAAGTGPGDADCGASGSAPLLPRVTESEALANILSNIPTHVWVKEGDICSVCLDPFPAEAAGLAASGRPIVEVCDELRRLDPPVVVTRCGHALHVQCAEAAVAAASAHHVRCPLCRQPVTLQGETAAVMFS